MKHPLFRIGLAGLAILLLTVSGCDTGTSPSGSPAGNVRSSTLSLGRTSVDASTLDAGDRVFFRSSDIEFWQIDSVADIAGIVSAKHRPEGAVDFALGHSLEYALGDAVESILFMASRDVVVGINRTDLNPAWAENVAAFVAAGKTKINAIRLDIGSGMVTFEIDGETVDVHTADWSNPNGIDGNSIFFVDRAFLARPLLITRDMEWQMVREGATAASLDLGFTPSECTLVETIHHSSSTVDTETPIDLNGALIVPMDPVTLTGFDPATETLDIVVSWDMADAVEIHDGTDFMQDRVGQTCFDFDVSVVRTPK
jgi:hypothetical protein